MCEVAWTGPELAALVLGTVGLATAGVLAIILLCVWLAARPWPAPRDNHTGEAPIGRVRPLQQPAEAQPAEEATEEAAAIPAATVAAAAARRRHHNRRRGRRRTQDGVRGTVIGVAAISGLGRLGRSDTGRPS